MKVASRGGDSVESLPPPTECFVCNFLLATPYNDELNTLTEIVLTCCYGQQEMFFFKCSEVLNALGTIVDNRRFAVEKKLTNHSTSYHVW